MVIADDLTEEGGIRTRILGEMNAVQGAVSFTLVVKLRAKNLHIARVFRRWMEENHPGVRVLFVPFIPHHALPLLREMIMVPNLVVTTIACLAGSMRQHPVRVYSHNLECSLAGKVVARLLDVPNVVDIHGDEIEENISMNGWRRTGWRSRFWRAMMRMALRGCTEVVCVSRAHKSHLETTYGVESVATVVPCCVSEPASDANVRRSEFLERHGSFVRPSVLLFYSGSSARWQMVDSMVGFLRAIHRAGIDCGMIMLLSDRWAKDIIRRSLDPEIAQRVLIDSIDHETALSIASVADCAFLLREDLPLNRVSSPTKFAEYLISGLPVLITRSVGDYSEALEVNRLGKIVDLDRIEDSAYASSMVREIKEDVEIRDRCRRYALQNLTWDVHRRTLERIFLGR